MSKKYKVIAGIDIGNGYVKGSVGVNGSKPHVIDMPAAVAYVTKSDTTSMDKNSTYDFPNKMNAYVKSPAINSEDELGQVIFGTRAVKLGYGIKAFDVWNAIPKCKDPLSINLLLGSIAGSLVENAYVLDGDIDSVIDADVVLATSLPIEDYRVHRLMYKNDLIKGVHVVTIHNFDREITVNITFTNVQIVMEGAAAQFALSSSSDALLNKFVENARTQVDLDPGVTGAYLKAATNTIGIDIGEGTVNFPVFESGAISIESSTTIPRGYGNVLEKAMQTLSGTNGALKSRKQIAEHLNLDRSKLIAIRAALYDLYKEQVDAEKEILIMEIASTFAGIFSSVGSQTEAVFIYGGGSTPLMDKLLPKLVRDSKIGDVNVPIIYLDSEFSRNLNRMGLYIVAEQLA